MISWKKAVLACAVIGLTCTVAQAKPIRVGAAVYGLKGEFMQMWTNALKAHPAAKDGSVQLTVFDGNYDALTHILAALPVHWRFFVKTKIFETLPDLTSTSNELPVRRAFAAVKAAYPQISA